MLGGWHRLHLRVCVVIPGDSLRLGNVLEVPQIVKDGAPICTLIPGPALLTSLHTVSNALPPTFLKKGSPLHSCFPAATA